MSRCCLCGKELKEFHEENNPWPLATGEDDVCCADCNMEVISDLDKSHLSGIERTGT